MTYVLVDGENVTYPYSVTDLRRANPQVSMRADPPPETLAEFGMFPVEQTERPSYDPITQDLVRSVEQQGGTWREVWTITDASSEAVQARLSAKRAGMVVTMRQARLALLGAGRLAEVEAALASLPSPEKEAAQISWEYAAEVRRISPLVSGLAPALGLDDAALDALFDAAAAIE